MTTVMFVIGGFGLVLINVLLNGFALKILWGWFIVPTFNVPGLSIPAALGFSVIVSLLTKQYLEDKRSPRDKIIYHFSVPVFGLAIGWTFHLFM